MHAVGTASARPRTCWDGENVCDPKADGLKLSLRAPQGSHFEKHGAFARHGNGMI